MGKDDFDKLFDAPVKRKIKEVKTDVKSVTTGVLIKELWSRHGGFWVIVSWVELGIIVWLVIK